MSASGRRHRRGFSTSAPPASSRPPTSPAPTTSHLDLLRGRKNVDPTTSAHHLPIPKIIAEGLIVGLVTGLVGAGGGFLVVPALALLGGLPMPIAVGTSLIVIAMKSFAGLGGYLASVHINWGVALAVTAAAVIGALIGARLTAMVNPDALRKGFGWFVLAMSSVILAQEIHLAVGIAAAALTAVAAVVTYVCSRYCALSAAPTHRRVRAPRDGGVIPARNTPAGTMAIPSVERSTPWLVTRTQSPRYSTGCAGLRANSPG